MDFESILLIIFGIIIAGEILFSFIKQYFFDNPKEIKSLRNKTSNLEKQYENTKNELVTKQKEIQELKTNLNTKFSQKHQELEREYSFKYEELESLYFERLKNLTELIESEQYKLIAKTIVDNTFEDFLCYSEQKRFTSDLSSFTNTNLLITEIQICKDKINLLESESNLTAIPYMAQIIADFETYELEYIAKKLDWGSSQERLKKVKSIRELRADAKAMVEKNKEAQYELSYLLELFPELEEIIECEFKSLPHISINLVEDRDVARDYLSKEEYAALSTTERNQLALDRYLASHNKSKWQIGRDYEQFVGYKYTLDGYTVDNFGTYKGLEDLGRDVIAKKENKTLIIQCKYWSSLKLIHEKHITQLYGTVMSYCIENNINDKYVTGVLVTNITLSDTAKEFAKRLHIEYIEGLEKGNYPCIKCNIGATGEKIYHLPFDQQYDATKIEPHKGEFYALTVKEAEDAGFRRAHKWFST